MTASTRPDARSPGAADRASLHCLIDAIGVRTGSSAIVLEQLLAAWAGAYPADRFTVVTDSDELPFAVPDSADVRRLGAGRVGRVLVATVALRRAVAACGADVVLSGNPGTALTGTGVPRAGFVHDLRHEHRPGQFTVARRLVRRITWGQGFRTADVLMCVSDRTRRDLITRHPRLAAKAITVHLGADHVDSWAVPHHPDAEPYVLAFGHFGNKNADKVLDAWPLFRARHPGVRLVLVGMPPDDLTEIRRRIDDGLPEVAALPWVSDGAFQELFAGAAMVAFPSDFEGFGLPALEAMRLGVPLVVSTDPALLEITGGHAIVARDLSPATLAAAMGEAYVLGPGPLEVARRHAGTFRWRRSADLARQALLNELPATR